MTKPAVSVLIDTYNQERYIEQAIVSALEQDFPASDYEVLVVDDGSTDGTTEIVRKFAPRVRLLRKPNGGQASAFNAGILDSRGDIIAFLDGDDWFAPRKLTAVMNALEQNPQAAAVGHGHYKFRDQTREVSVCAPPKPRYVNLRTPDSAREAHDAWLFLIMGALTARKKIFEPVLPVPEELVFCADGPLSMVSMAGGACVLDEPLFYYRQHESNLYAFDADNETKTRRRLDMHRLSLELGLGMLVELGVAPDSAGALVGPALAANSRLSLSTFGGSRLKTLRTEMRAFHSEFGNPSIGYRIYKYLVLAPATLLLPPRRFYSIRNWYGQRNLGRFRKWATG